MAQAARPVGARALAGRGPAIAGGRRDPSWRHRDRARAQIPDGSLQGYTLYRVTPGATQWQSLGPMPEMQVIYASAPVNELLWALPGSWSVNGVPTGHVYTVTYP